MLEIMNNSGNDWESTIKYFNDKINAYNGRLRDGYSPFSPNHVNIRRLIVQRNQLVEAYEIYKIISKKTDIGIKMFFKPHNF